MKLELRQDIYAITSPPGDDNKPHFSLEIGRQNGESPSPFEVMAVGLRILEDLAIKHNISNAREFLINVMNSDYTIQEITAENKNNPQGTTH